MIAQMPSLSPSAQQTWFAVQLRPNMRLIAERHLTRQGFRCFCPTRLETIHRRGRLKTEPRPLFPGYLFISNDAPLPQWRLVNSTRGVLRLVTDGRSRPGAMPREFMTALLARCDANGRLHTADELQEGDRVRILSGPFAGLVSRIDQLDQQGRLQLLIQVLGRLVQTDLSSATVEKLECARPV